MIYRSALLAALGLVWLSCLLVCVAYGTIACIAKMYEGLTPGVAWLAVMSFVAGACAIPVSILIDRIIDESH